MDPEKKIKFNALYMKTDPLMWIDADIESINIPVNEPHRNTFFIKKPRRISYNEVKKNILKNGKCRKKHEKNILEETVWNSSQFRC